MKKPPPPRSDTPIDKPKEYTTLQEAVRYARAVVNNNRGSTSASYSKTHALFKKTRPPPTDTKEYPREFISGHTLRMRLFFKL